MIPLRARVARAAIVLAALLGAPVPAASAAGLTRGISDAAYFNHPDPAVRSLGLARARRAGAGYVRVHLGWSYVARREPGGPGEARDPGWPGYDFDYLDRVLREIDAAGLVPLVTVRGAPEWAEAPGRWRFAAAGTWAPSPAAYGDFAAAAAERYSGRFPDPLRPGATLPAVRHWQAWNEPNLPRYLQPQWVASGRRWLPYAPAHYRRMLNAFGDGIRSRNPRAVIVTAGTAPLGDPDGTGRMGPVRFWQSFFCLGRPPRPTRTRCPDPPRFDALAHHPFSVGDPDAPRRPITDASVADLHRLVTLLRTAERSGRAPGGRHPLWVTELNWSSRPPLRSGLAAAQQQRFVARGLYRLWAAGVRTAIWHFISDRRDLPHRPAGLWRRDGRAKPALRAFSFPFVVVRETRRRARVWGLLPRPGRRMVAIERRRGHRWVRAGRARVSASGTIRGRIAVRGRPLLRARAGRTASAAWRVDPG